MAASPLGLTSTLASDVLLIDLEILKANSAMVVYFTIAFIVFVVLNIAGILMLHY
jgi:hypothetical protein